MAGWPRARSRAASRSTPPTLSRPRTAEHPVAVVGRGHHARVERAAAEVVDDQGRVRRDGCGRARRRSRPAAATGSGISAGSGRPARRAASASRATRAASQPAGWVSVTSSIGPPLTRTASSRTRLEHGRDHRGDADLAVAERDGVLVAAALRGRLEPGRVEPGGVHGVAPDQHRPVGLARRPRSAAAGSRRRAAAALCPSGQRRIAVVCEVPKSMPSRNPERRWPWRRV